jgi:Kef-type K+ transport system membrane component KefB
MSNLEFAAQAFLQLAVILGVIRVVGLAARWVGQPQVVGEMIAGVVIGPSLFGWIFPDLQAALFPKSSLPVLYVLSQVGLVLYMFLIGAEFSVDLIRRRIHSAASVSIAGMAAPFLLGGILALYLYDDTAYFTAGVSKWEGILFMGAAMSITAFPMLARIIYERGLTGTSLGTLALAAGAIDDAAAWCILAVVLASFSGDSSIAFLAAGGGVAYALIVAVLGRTVLARLGRVAEQNNGVSGPMLSFVLMLLMLGAWFTDSVGIYAVFGAFILGVAMPRGVVTRELQRKLEPVATNFLLPLFFVYSGLNTQLGLVVTPELWMVMLAVIVVACIGKGGACWLAARLNGETNREALAVGTLMNARGLMELILLNIALDRGIITPVLFTIMVVMAVVTTLMTSPLFELVYRRFRREAPNGDDMTVVVKA